MAIHPGTRRGAQQADVLQQLLRERGIDRYGLFLVSGEGKTLPDGTESTSGFVVDQTARVHFFWLDWDGNYNRPTFKHFESVTPESDWLEDPEYRSALEAAGVAPAS
jgi:hypothetical protein